MPLTQVLVHIGSSLEGLFPLPLHRTRPEAVNLAISVAGSDRAQVLAHMLVERSSFAEPEKVGCSVVESEDSVTQLKELMSLRVTCWGTWYLWLWTLKVTV